MNHPNSSHSAPWRLAAAWILVIAPLGWGVYQSVVKSLPLFRTTAPRAVDSSTGGAPAAERQADPIRRSGVTP